METKTRKEREQEDVEIEKKKTCKYNARNEADYEIKIKKIETAKKNETKTDSKIEVIIEVIKKKHERKCKK